MADETQIPSDVPVRRYQDDGETVIVADLGLAATDAAVEVLDDVAIIVVDHPEGERQFEIDLPENRISNTFITNGVLTIEVNEA